MSTVQVNASVVPAPPAPTLRRFTVDEYHRMVQAGVFAEDDRFELLEGWIVPKRSRNPPHDAILDLLAELLRGVLPSGWRIRVQSAVTTLDSEPEPDLAVVRGAARDYLTRHPGPAETGLIVEVSDATAAQDRTLKGRLYARAGFECYWLVNLPDRRLVVYTQPTGPAAEPSYRQRQDYAVGDEVRLTLGGREVVMQVKDLLP